MEITEDMEIKIREKANKWLGVDLETRCTLLYINVKELLVDFAKEILEKYAKD